MIELRCGGTMHGKLNTEQMTIEVKCGRRSCGVRRGVIVLHTFDLHTGQLTATTKFADPIRNEEDHAPGKRSAVRPA